MTTRSTHYNISNKARKWKHQDPANRSYRAADSKCDCYGHVGEWSCSTCPHPDCLHSQERENESTTEKIAVGQVKRKSVYDDASIAEDYQFNNSGR